MRQLKEKEKGELNFWIDYIIGFGCVRESGLSYEDQWSKGMQGRIERFVAEVPHKLSLERGTWVDLGSGPYSLLIEAPPQLTRIAIDPLMKFYQHHDLLPKRPGVDGMVLIESPGELLPLADEVADIVTCFNCLDHVEDPWATLTQMARILKIGGCLILEVDCGGKTDYMHPQSFSIEDVLAHAKELGLQPARVSAGKLVTHREGAEEVFFCFQRLEGSSAPRAAPPKLGELFPMLALESVHSHNILALPDPSTQTLYIGIRQIEGPFSYDKFFNNGYAHKIFQGPSVDNVRQQIEEWAAQGGA